MAAVALIYSAASAISRNSTMLLAKTQKYSPASVIVSRRRPLQISSVAISSPNPHTANEETFVSRFRPHELRKGSDVLVEALEREGVAHVFAYPGCSSADIHQSLTRSATIRNILPRHEQGGASGNPGVCIASSGPGVTNLVSGLADALLDSVPLVAITGQVPRPLIGTNAFHEIPTVELTNSITKHNFLVLHVEDIPRNIKEAFFIARSGRPGPVLVDIPSDVLEQVVIPEWDQPMKLDAYLSSLPNPPCEKLLEKIVELMSQSEKPVLYVGGGCLNSSSELRKFVELTRIPVASALMGLGSYPGSDEEGLSLQMLGMYGTMYSNYAVNEADLLLAFGARFDDHVTGKLEAFASRAKIVHIDIDSTEIGKNKQPHLSICADISSQLWLVSIPFYPKTVLVISTSHRGGKS